MNVAIIGAGFTGLSAAYTLAKHGHRITLFEKDDKPGGLAIGFHVPGWEWTLEKHYHHWFANDTDVLNLARRINYPVEIRRPITSVYVDSSIYQLDSAQKVLTFPKLPIIDRFRMAFVLAFLRFNPYWKILERYKTSEILPKVMGRNAYHVLWEPQLSNKFGEYKNDISLAWFWARIKKRTANLAYPKGGFLRFAEAVEKTLVRQGALFHYNTDITSFSEDNGKLILTIQGRNGGEVYKNSFDKILVTLPGSAFAKLAPSLPKSYMEKLTSLKGLGAINLILRLKEPFFSDRTYWLSVCDLRSPVMAIVEHTNFMDKKYYNNEHLVYLGNYLPMNHRYFSYTPKNLLKEFDPFLKKINSDYQRYLIDTHMFQAPFAQPIIPINYSKHVPPLRTPLKHVYLANMQQVYPWDRGTNFAVQLGENVARTMMSDKTI